MARGRMDGPIEIARKSWSSLQLGAVGLSLLVTGSNEFGAEICSAVAECVPPLSVSPLEFVRILNYSPHFTSESGIENLSRINQMGTLIYPGNQPCVKTELHLPSGEEIGATRISRWGATEPGAKSLTRRSSGALGCHRNVSARPAVTRLSLI